MGRYLAGFCGCFGGRGFGSVASVLLANFDPQGLQAVSEDVAQQMFVALAMRYGWKGAAWVMVPSAIAISLAPTLLRS